MIREPKSQAEIDRNIFVMLWMMIACGIPLFFNYSGTFFSLFLIGLLLRVTFLAIKCDREDNRYFNIIPPVVALEPAYFRFTGEMIDSRFTLLAAFLMILFLEWKIAKTPFHTKTAGNRSEDITEGKQNQAR